MDGFIPAIDFLKITGMTIDNLQVLIRHHRVRYTTKDNNIYIQNGEAEYFRDYHPDSERNV